MVPDDEFEMESCRACHGSGKVISNLGGSPSEVDCPWCEGSGKFILEHDAQAHWGPQKAAEDVEEAPESAETAPDEPVDA
jgi:DnaJ-class molecular chaperone